MKSPRRRCRSCGRWSEASVSCPGCGTPYGPLEFGLDRDPDALPEWDPLKKEAPAQEPGQLAAFVPREVAQGER